MIELDVLLTPPWWLGVKCCNTLTGSEVGAVTDTDSVCCGWPKGIPAAFASLAAAAAAAAAPPPPDAAEPDAAAAKSCLLMLPCCNIVSAAKQPRYSFWVSRGTVCSVRTVLQQSKGMEGLDNSQKHKENTCRCCCLHSAEPDYLH